MSYAFVLADACVVVHLVAGAMLSGWMESITAPNEQYFGHWNGIVADVNWFL